MANHGLTDIVSTVTISKSEYENLVRDSEKLGTLKRYITQNSYMLRADIEAILGVKEGEK